MLIDTKDSEVKKISMKFDKLHADLKTEFIKALNKFYTDIENIYLQTKNTLLTNLSVYENKVISKLAEIQDIVSCIGVETGKYNIAYLKLSHSGK